MSKDSNVRANIMTSSRVRGWRKRGIYKAEVSIPRSPETRLKSGAFYLIIRRIFGENFLHIGFVVRVRTFLVECLNG